MSKDRSRSPSPPPDAPIASTPGPRATALQKIFLNALTASIKANSYSNFSACFPTPAQYCPNAIEGVWQQVNARLEQECMGDFDQILEEKHVVEGLNQWETMIEDARRRKHRAVDGEMPEKPLHTLSADELYTAHVTPYLHKASEELQTKIQKSHLENASTMVKITQQRAEIERLLGGLQSSIKDIEGGVNAMHTNQDTNIDAMRNEIWQMEQEVAATR